MFPFFIDVHIKEVQADVKKSFQNIKNPPGSDINNAYPVRVQLPTNHLKTSHITNYKATHRHRKISQSSTSTSTLSHLSLKAPVEGKQHFKLHLTQWNEGFSFYDSLCIIDAEILTSTTDNSFLSSCHLLSYWWGCTTNIFGVVLISSIKAIKFIQNWIAVLWWTTLSAKLFYLWLPHQYFVSDSAINGICWVQYKWSSVDSCCWLPQNKLILTHPSFSLKKRDYATNVNWSHLI